MSKQVRTRKGISRLLHPKSIVVIGASAKKVAGGNEAMRNLRGAAYDGQLHVVHPSGAVIEGVPSVASIADLPDGIDLALVNLPAASVVDTLLELDAAGVGGALVPSGGMSAQQVDDLRSFAESARMVVHGPNCMGVLNVVDGIPLWFYEGMLTDLAPGRVALVTQSGSASFLTRAVEGVGFSHVISSGNEAGLTTADYLGWLAHDPDTAAVGVVMESMRDATAFSEAILELRTAGKPVVVLKVGRTEAGSKASVAHTGAIVGQDAAYAALFERLDVPTVDDYEELAVALSYLGSPHARPAAGARAAIVTDSGGEAALAADIATAGGVDFPQFTDATLAELSGHLPGMAVRNPLDAGGSPGSADDTYAQVMPIVAADDNIDSIVLLVEALEAMSDVEVEFARDMYEAARAVAEGDSGKPVVVATPTGTNTSDRVREIVGPHVPILRGLRPAIATLRVMAGNQRPVELVGVRPADLPDAGAVDRWRAELADVSGALPSQTYRRLLADYGIPFVESTVVPDVEAGTTWASGRYPVVAKVVSADVPHRSDVGGVVTGIADEDALVRALKQIEFDVTAALPGAGIEGYEIQEHIGHAQEALIGFVDDPAIGPTVTVGSGGVLVELLADVAVGLAPLDGGDAEPLIRSTRIGTVLDGYRNLVEPTDLSMLAAALVSISWMASDLAGVLSEGDFNPVLVDVPSGRVRVVDALIVSHGDTTSKEQ